MFLPGLTELLIIVLLVFLFFGAKRLPDIGTGLGKTVKEIRNAKKEFSRDKERAKREETEEGPASDKKSLEAKLKDKVIEQIPGIGKAKKLKDKADKIKKIVS